MLNYLIQFSLKKRLLVALLTLGMCIYGGLLLKNLPVDVFPNLNRPTVTILTEAHGLAPEEVETLVTMPIESVVNGTPGVLRLRSNSGIGLSIVYIEFDWGTEIFKNRQLIAERLQLLEGRLPSGMQPMIGPVSSIMGEIQFLGLVSEKSSVTPMEMRSFADWNIRPRLMTIPGISQVTVMGGEVKQYQIFVSSEKLQQKTISLEEFKNALSEISENTTGGFIEIDKKEYLIRPLGRANSLEDIENSLVGMHLGKPVLVKDVASVKIGGKVKRGEASINGKRSVLLTIQKQPHVSTISLTKTIEREVSEISKTLPEGLKIRSDLFKQADFIETAIDNVELALRDGIIMVMIVLFLFLMNWRTTSITLVAIPTSLLITAIVFYIFDISINTMTLGGLAIAIGELVDDAIVDVENVFRRLKQNKAAGSPKGYLRVIYEASTEVRNSIVLATIIVVLVFIPIFALGGIEGRLFVPLGIAYIVSIIASLIVSLSVTPILCSVLLPNSKSIQDEKDGVLVQKIKSLALVILEWTIPRPKTVLAGAFILLMASVALVPTMGRNFLPEFNEGTATIGIGSRPGISLAESDKIGFKAEEIILSVPEVKSTVRRTGRAEMDEHAEGVHWHEIDVDFKAGGRSRGIVLNEIREKIEAIGDVYVNLGQPISHRLDHLLSGVRAQIAIKIFGPDVGELRRLAGEVQASLENTKGLVDLQTEPLVLVPQLKIAIDRDYASEHGLRSGTLAKDLEIALNGEVVGHIIENQRSHEVFVRLDDKSRSNADTISETLIKYLPNGQEVKLSDVAEVYQGTGPNMINREDMQRRIVVSANTYGRDLGSVVNEVKKTINEKVKTSEGYFIKFGGQFESQQVASKRIFWLGILSLLGIFFVLYANFRSTMLSLQIMLNVPLALIGSLVAVFITERNISIATLVAFITLCGIASRNGIMLISHYLYLMKFEGEKFDQKMVIRGSLERLVPVLMTASTAILALIPLLISKGEPGKEILYPVAVVIVGGLVSSTILDLLVTPTLFLKFGRRAVEKYLNTTNNKITGEWK
jgi:CzcA family heavy metal efflux pump